jgi:uncharacterized protein YyaL (SSP411 family)
MAHESFEDEEVAEFLNQHFVCIKVDREERPDIDAIYMTVCQAMTSQGGWPLTVFLTPDQKPFFAGTYFPKRTKYGRIGFLELCQQLYAKWVEDRERIESASDGIVSALHKSVRMPKASQVPADLVDQAVDDLLSAFDEEYGGFGSAPKFPSPHQLLFLLRQYSKTKDAEVLQAVTKTLDAMYQGGIFDHVGYGFARYSTDEQWLVPHFEKMLYDNALLTMAYTEAYQVTGRKRYRAIAEAVIEYVRRDLSCDGGAFASAEDADSEGVEGKFYTWSSEEVEAVLGVEEGRRYQQCYGFVDGGNFEGKNIPNLVGCDEQTLDWIATGSNEIGEQARRWNEQLRQAREQRVRPHRDDKVLTSWNALMMVALAKAGRAFVVPDYIDAAVRAFAFIENHLVRDDGRLLARYRDGEAAIPAYVDDYAFLTWACIELYEATLDVRFLERAIHWQDKQIELFWDAEHGGFFLYGNDGESLIVRPKEVYDGAIPSGNSVSAYNLLRLDRLTGNTHYGDLANELFSAFAAEASHYPPGHTMYLTAVDFAFSRTQEVVVVGMPENPDFRRAIGQLQQMYLPYAVWLVKAPDPTSDQATLLARLAPFTRELTSIADKTTVFICENFACQAPFTDVDQLAARLRHEDFSTS